MTFNLFKSLFLHFCYCIIPKIELYMYNLLRNLTFKKTPILKVVMAYTILMSLYSIL